MILSLVATTLSSARCLDDLDEICGNLVIGPLARISCKGLVISKLDSRLNQTAVGSFCVGTVNTSKNHKDSSVEGVLLDSVLNGEPTNVFSGLHYPFESDVKDGKFSTVFVVFRNHLVPRGVVAAAFEGEVYLKDLDPMILDFLSLLGNLAADSRSMRPSNYRGVGSENRLSSRQLRILDLISQGMTNYQIGRLINISESSVKQETMKIYRFLGVDGRITAVEVARERQIISNHSDDRPATELGLSPLGDSISAQSVRTSLV